MIIRNGHRLGSIVVEPKPKPEPKKPAAKKAATKPQPSKE